MARRRRPIRPVPSGEPIPERLARCAVEDWVAPDEVPPHLPTTVNGRPPDAAYIAGTLTFLARSRHRDALTSWLVARPGAQRPAYGTVRRTS